MVAALSVARHDVDSSSPAFRMTAARSSQGQRDHSFRASAAAAMACSMFFSDSFRGPPMIGLGETRADRGIRVPYPTFYRSAHLENGGDVRGRTCNRLPTM